MKLDNLISGVYPINAGCNTVSFQVFVFTQWVKIKTHEILIFFNVFRTSYSIIQVSIYEVDTYEKTCNRIFQ